MSLFEFTLDPVERIAPWGPNGAHSWFGLTHGRFYIDLGDEQLLRYSPEINAHWRTDLVHADYQIAAIARDVLSAAQFGVESIPPVIGKLVEDWSSFCELRHRRPGDEDGSRVPAYAVDRLDRDPHRLAYDAFRWLGARSPRLGYFVAEPSISFIRIGDRVRLGWDNRACIVDGVRVWTATQGYLDLHVAFSARSFGRSATGCSTR
jgi:hypothetical protein